MVEMKYFQPLRDDTHSIALRSSIEAIADIIISDALSYEMVKFVTCWHILETVPRILG